MNKIKEHTQMKEQIRGLYECVRSIFKSDLSSKQATICINIPPYNNIA